MGVPLIRGPHFGGPNTEDYNILGSISRSPIFGKLSCQVWGEEGHANFGRLPRCKRT